MMCRGRDGEPAKNSSVGCHLLFVSFHDHYSYLKPLGLIIEPLSIPPKPSLPPQYFQRYQVLQRQPDVFKVLRCPAPPQELPRHVAGAPPLVEEAL